MNPNIGEIGKEVIRNPSWNENYYRRKAIVELRRALQKSSLYFPFSIAKNIWRITTGSFNYVDLLQLLMDGASDFAHYWDLRITSEVNVTEILTDKNVQKLDELDEEILIMKCGKSSWKKVEDQFQKPKQEIDLTKYVPALKKDFP